MLSCAWGKKGDQIFAFLIVSMHEIFEETW